MRNQANLRAALRGAVALYLITIAVRLVKGAQENAASMSIGIACLIAALFTLAGIFFGVYSFKSYRKDLEAADTQDREDFQDEYESDSKSR